METEGSIANEMMCRDGVIVAGREAAQPSAEMDPCREAGNCELAKNIAEICKGVFSVLKLLKTY